MHKTRHRWSRTLAVILLAPGLLGTTYKWVDAQGQVHFTDSPPPAGTHYEVIETTVRHPADPSRTAGNCAVSPPQPVAEITGASRDDARCVDALYQMRVLGGDWRVYMPGPGNDRTYLHDRDRPAEIERLTGERDANCSEEPDVLVSQKLRANELFQALSAAGRGARNLRICRGPRLTVPRRTSRSSWPGSLHVARM
jgi:hypothetical protein